MKAFIITGPESSGSVYIAKIIAFVLGATENISDWSGRGFCDSRIPDIEIIHRSQPWGTASQYSDVNDFKNIFNGYDLYFIVCTRYHMISNKSKESKFNRTGIDLKNNLVKSKSIFTEIIKNEKSFIWNYETMLYLREIYFDLLYKFLESKKSYYPTDIIDGNVKYLSVAPPSANTAEMVWMNREPKKD